MLDADTPSIDEFKQACRDEFAFLKDYGFEEGEPPSEYNKYQVHFANSEYQLTISGIHWGSAAHAELADCDGVVAPPSWFVPRELRGDITLDPTLPSQLAEIRRYAEIVRRFCLSTLLGDRGIFDSVAHEWRRSHDMEYRARHQERRLP